MDKAYILIVDDKLSKLPSLKSVLNHPPYIPIVAASAQVAQQKAAEQDFALIIIDVQTLLDAGVALVKRICRMQICNTPMMVVIDSYSDVDFITKEYNLESVDYINRAVPPNILGTRIENLVLLYQKSSQIVHQTNLLHKYEQHFGPLISPQPTEEPVIDEPLKLINWRLRHEIAERELIETELRFHLKRTEALYHVSRSMIAIEELPELLQTVVDHIAQTLSADLSAMIFLDMEAEEIENVVIGGKRQADWYPVSYESLVEGVPGKALHTTEPVLSAECVKRPYRESNGTYGTDPGSVIAAAMRYRHELYGVMMVINWGDNRAFNDQDGDLMAAMANQAAIAISHANLFRETRQALDQVRQIIHSVPSAMILLDSSGWVQLTNHTADEYLSAIGTWNEDGCLSKLGTLPLTELITKFQAGKDDFHEFSLENRHYQVVIRPFNKIGEQDKWILVLRDISVQKATLNRQFSQRQHSLVGQLAAGVAHDFNNILAVITLYCQLLEKTPLPEKHQKYLKTILQQSQLGASLVSQLLDFSRQSLMEPMKIDLIPFLNDTLNLLARIFPENIELQFVTHIDSLYVHVDSAHLKQVFMNLSINARDAMNGGGNFKIEVDATEIGVNDSAPVLGMAPGIWATVSVSDTGFGMANEIQGKIFEPFFTTKSPDKGTGLGLAQAYGIIQQLGGEITVSSATGIGTTFRIYLPVTGFIPASFQPEPVDIRHEETYSDKTILLVEDEDSVRSALKEMLLAMGFQNLLLAENGEEALCHFHRSEGEIDLVFSDMVMPQMGGPELFEILRQEKPDIKMIISTGYPLENEGETLLNQGILDWVLKPFRIEDVSTKIFRVLAN
ncbi:MAG: response regulator [Chloroflexota bacterium]